MAFGGFILTNSGRNLLAKIQSGEVQGLNFTKFSIGDGAAPASITNMTALVNEKKVVHLKNKTAKDGITTLEGSFSNEDITTGFFFKEWGIYASNGQTEILYAYDNAGADAEYIAQKGAVLYEKMLKAALIISSDVSVTIDTSGAIYATPEMVSNAIENKEYSFTEVITEADIQTGEKPSTIFGKILKSIKTFRTAIAENVQNILLNASAIDVVSQEMEQKADKPITIGINNGIRLIGEITDYTTLSGFNLEAMIHNIYMKQGTQLSNAFLIVGKWDNNYNIDGKLQILTDRVNISNSIKVTIQVTDAGKIYSIGSQYATSCSWNIIKKTNNVVIFDNPTVVTAIDGNVIWDSELNKTSIATTDKIDISSYLLNEWATVGGVKLVIDGKMAHITGNIVAGIKTKNTVILDLTGLVIFDMSCNPTIISYGQNPALGLLRINNNSSIVAVDNNWAISPSGVNDNYMLDLHIPIK